MSEEAKGIAAMVTACTVWGLSGIYYKLLDHVPPLEVLSHRTLWGLIFFICVLTVQGRLRALPQALAAPRTLLVVTVAAFMVSLNWFVFISAIQQGYATDASLGYFTFPLVAVLMGALFYREQLTRMQGFAVALAASAVVVLAVGLGATPWVALILATSLSLYGVAKKGLVIGPVLSVTAEVLLLSPLALGWLFLVHSEGGGAFGTDAITTGMLMFAGIITAIPLILFSYAARRVSMATIGLTQYINPTLQFLVATLLFREAFTIWHAIAFAMIWTALAIYTAASLRRNKAARKAASVAGMSGPAV